MKTERAVEVVQGLHVATLQERAMNPSVKTTHVIPRQLPPVRLASVSTLLRCPFCMSTIGAYKTQADRTRLEAKHFCTDKVAVGSPAVSIPFN
jgi:hypothetical protein